MKTLYDAILARIDECEQKRRMFIMPNVDATQYIIHHTEVPATGSVITGDEWTISKGSESLHIRYESKDKCRTFQDKPDRSVIVIKGQNMDSDTLKSISYSYGWDEQ